MYGAGTDHAYALRCEAESEYAGRERGRAVGRVLVPSLNRGSCAAVVVGSDRRIVVGRSDNAEAYAAAIAPDTAAEGSAERVSSLTQRIAVGSEDSGAIVVDNVTVHSKCDSRPCQTRAEDRRGTVPRTIVCRDNSVGLSAGRLLRYVQGFVAAVHRNRLKSGERICGTELWNLSRIKVQSDVATGAASGEIGSGGDACDGAASSGGGGLFSAVGEDDAVAGSIQREIAGDRLAFGEGVGGCELGVVFVGECGVDAERDVAAGAAAAETGAGFDSSDGAGSGESLTGGEGEESCAGDVKTGFGGRAGAVAVEQVEGSGG